MKRRAERKTKKRKSGGAGRRARRVKVLPGRTHRPAARFWTAFFVTLAVLGAGVGVVVADRNTRRIGWNTDETQLAFSPQSRKLNVRLMGNSFLLDFDAVGAVLNEHRRFCLTFARVAPAPQRLCVEAMTAGGRELVRLYQKYLYGPLRKMI